MLPSQHCPCGHEPRGRWQHCVTVQDDSVAVLLVLSHKSQSYLEGNKNNTKLTQSVIWSAGHCCATGLSVLNLCCLWWSLCWLSFLETTRVSSKFCYFMFRRHPDLQQSHRLCHRQFFLTHSVIGNVVLLYGNFLCYCAHYEWVL